MAVVSAGMSATGLGRSPDFVGVGAQRSGTSWWYRLIAAHPRCSAHPDAKELHFFDRFWAQPFDESEVAAYHAYFDPDAPGIVGEWTPRYLFDPWAPPLLRLCAPDARVLVMLRDPIERYRSGVHHSLSYDGWPAHAIVATDAFQRGLYGQQLARLLAHFPTEHVLVLQYEQCVAEPRRELARTYGFLGLDSSFVPDAITERGVQATEGTKTPLPAAAHDALAAAYGDDLLHLSTLGTGLDLQLWSTARAAGLG